MWRHHFSNFSLQFWKPNNQMTGSATLVYEFVRNAWIKSRDNRIWSSKSAYKKSLSLYWIQSGRIQLWIRDVCMHGSISNFNNPYLCCLLLYWSQIFCQPILCLAFSRELVQVKNFWNRFFVTSSLRYTISLQIRKWTMRIAKLY